MNIDKVSLGPPTGGASEAQLFAKKNAETMKPTPDSFGKAMDKMQNQVAANKMPNQGKGTESKKAEESKAPKRGEPREDKLTEREKKADTKGEKGVKNPKEQEKASSKQKAMLKFMDSMESEFGIPPERIVGAMAKLNDEDLVKPPEETFSQVIENLDLDPKDEDKASVLYAGLLLEMAKAQSAQSQQIPKPVVPPFFEAEVQSVKKELSNGQSLEDSLHAMALVPGQGQNPSTKYLVNAKEQRVSLNNSIDRMNEKFFMKSSEQKMQMEQKLGSDVASQSALGAENQQGQFGFGLDQSMTRTEPTPFDLSRNLGLDNPQKSELPLAGQDATAKSAQSSSKESIESLDSQSQDSTYSSLLEKLAGLGATAKALGESMRTDPQNSAAMKMEQALQGQQPLAAHVNQMMAQNAYGDQQSFGKESQGEKSSGDQNKSETSAKVDGAELKTDSFFVNSMSDDKKAMSLKDASAAAAAAGANLANVNQDPADKTQNMQQLINQAQYVMKKGGGEAIVKLTPEGLGQVHLKVMVQDGKVNVEMSAETKEAKKIIESSLADLKSSLGAHKLHVDSVKVDVGNQMSSSTDSQQQKSEFKFDQGREQARQFLNHFGEENSARRGGFYEMPELKAYGRRKDPEPIGAATEMSSTQRRYAGSAKGQGLNLVA